MAHILIGLTNNFFTLVFAKVLEKLTSLTFLGKQLNAPTAFLALTVCNKKTTFTAWHNYGAQAPSKDNTE
jgi:hypothetical protein